eukprot:543260-Prorocentrum_minimum.AAC.1
MDIRQIRNLEKIWPTTVHLYNCTFPIQGSSYVARSRSDARPDFRSGRANPLGRFGEIWGDLGKPRGRPRNPPRIPLGSSRIQPADSEAG